MHFNLRELSGRIIIVSFDVAAAPTALNVLEAVARATGVNMNEFHLVNRGARIVGENLNRSIIELGFATETVIHITSANPEAREALTNLGAINLNPEPVEAAAPALMR